VPESPCRASQAAQPLIEDARMQPIHIPVRLTFALAVFALAIGGCATAPAPSDPASVAATAAAAGAAAATTTTAGPVRSAAPGAGAVSPAASAAAAAAGAAVAALSSQKPFAEVIKGAKEIPGFYNIYERDDKVWIEIRPEQFDQPFFFAFNFSSGLGEKWFFGGLMVDSFIASFHRLNPTQVQLIARNTEYFATPDTPEARAVREAFSDSLLSAAPIVSQPHPVRKSVLIEANALLFADIPGANGMLERTYRQTYSFDSRNSSITKVRATPDLVAINVNAHYALQRVSQPAAGASFATLPPSTVPDIRSLFLGFYYNIAKLPEQPMRPRVADDRIGYFVQDRFDYSNDTTLTPKVNLIKRWRLEKKDPAAAVSEPKEPIVFWIDRNIPHQYRQTIMDGVLEWNKAFEKAGFKDAIQAKIQPDDADFDTIDSRHASIRWMPTARPIFGGVGPIEVDPRTGEILDADIGIDPVRLRNRRFMRVEQIPAQGASPAFMEHPERMCMMEDYAAQELNFTFDLLEARGGLDPNGPEAEAFVLGDLKDVVMHEVGHALGLRHNFRASTVYTQAQLNDSEFTREHGVAGSVMEYNAINIALPGEPQAAYGMTTLGPYDYWAIEYGYKEIAPDQEATELREIASRSNEPLLAYATDEDNSFGIDPEDNIGDLGSDPLQFARRRLLLARELWDRWQDRELAAGESYAVLRRTVGRGLIVVGQSSMIVAKYIGGVSTLRDHAGSPRPPLNPITAAQQREALDIIAAGIFSSDSFHFKPAFMRRLQVDYLDRGDMFDVGLSTTGVDYSLPGQVLKIQRDVLNLLMSDAVAQRIIDSEVKLEDPKNGFRLSELYASLHRSIWSELKTGQEITPLRRNLQREHLARIANALVRGSSTAPADARALLRQDARALRDELKAVPARAAMSKETQAHIAESLSTLDEALKASLQRQGV
jgi:hypothetical protein